MLAQLPVGVPASVCLPFEQLRAALLRKYMRPLGRLEVKVVASAWRERSRESGAHPGVLDSVRRAPLLDALAYGGIADRALGACEEAAVCAFELEPWRLFQLGWFLRGLPGLPRCRGRREGASSMQPPDQKRLRRS